MLTIEIHEMGEFANWILQVGDNDGEVDIKMSKDILFQEVSDHILTIVESTYPLLGQ